MGRRALRRQVTESLGDTGCGVMGAGGHSQGADGVTEAGTGLPWTKSVDGRWTRQ